MRTVVQTCALGECLHRQRAQWRQRTSISDPTLRQVIEKKKGKDLFFGEDDAVVGRLQAPSCAETFNAGPMHYPKTNR